MLRLVIWDLGDTLNTTPPGGQDKRPLDEYTEIELRPNAKRVLQTVQQRGYRQAVLSNTAVSDSASARRMLRNLGVERYFEYIFATASELDPNKPGKPDKVVFQHVLDTCGVCANEAVMIGNTWDTDILGANRLGIHALWLQNPEVRSRRNFSSLTSQPSWILPVWDIEHVPDTLELLEKSMAGYANDGKANDHNVSVSKPIGEREQNWLRALWQDEWGGESMVSRGHVYRLSDLSALVARIGSELVGAATYYTSGDGTELMSINAVQKGSGIGSRLLEAVEQDPRVQQSGRVWLITSNDNVDALRFYQRRGYRLTAIYPGAIDEARKIKSSIPVVGDHGIEVRDEIELSKALRNIGFM